MLLKMMSCWCLISFLFLVIMLFALNKLNYVWWKAARLCQSDRSISNFHSTVSNTFVASLPYFAGFSSILILETRLPHTFCKITVFQDFPFVQLLKKFLGLHQYCFEVAMR